MGGGRDKRKKAKERKDGPLPGKGADKTEKKTKKVGAGDVGAQVSFPPYMGGGAAVAGGCWR